MVAFVAADLAALRATGRSDVLGASAHAGRLSPASPALTNNRLEIRVVMPAT
jgi:hypothetical protein